VQRQRGIALDEHIAEQFDNFFVRESPRTPLCERILDEGIESSTQALVFGSGWSIIARPRLGIPNGENSLCGATRRKLLFFRKIR
jgi:hypothetical protein